MWDRFRVKFTIAGVGEAFGELVKHWAPRTVDRLLASLPLEGRAATWMEEVYFEVPIKIGTEKAVTEVETGAIAYWPMGNAICIFYGSSQPTAPVNLIGKITEGLELFRKVELGTVIRMERV